MHPVLFYLITAASLTLISSVGLLIINAAYSRQNLYPEISKKPLDEKNYKIFTLPNQMHVMMITSNSTEFSAIAIRSEIGYMKDPDYCQGMSNYLDQLLKSSNKYPSDDYLRKTLLTNSGTQSKVLGEVEKVHYLQVQNDGFYNTLDIVSQLFIDPVFSKQEMDKTIQQLQMKWLNQDRSQYLYQIIGKASHPFNQFYTGNVQSLYEIPLDNEKNPYIEVLKFLRAKYSANRMSLVIYTNESMKKRVTELLFEYFNTIINKQLSKVSFKQFGLPLLQQRFFYINSDRQTIRLIMNFRAENPQNAKAIQFIIYLLMEHFQINYCEEQIQNKLAYLCNFKIKEILNEFTILEISLVLVDIKNLAQVLSNLYGRINYIKGSQDLETYWNIIQQIQQVNTNYNDFDITDIIGLSKILKTYFNKDILNNNVLNKYDSQILQSVLSQLNSTNINIIYTDSFYDFSKYQSPLQQLKTVLIQQANIEEESGDLEQTHRKKKTIKVYIGKVRRRVRKQRIPLMNTEQQEKENQDQPEEDDHPAEMSLEVEQEIINTKYDYDIDHGIQVPHIEDFELNTMYTQMVFEAGLTANTVSALNTIITKVPFIQQVNIPDNFELQAPQQVQLNNPRSKKKYNFKYPSLLSSTDSGLLWHVQDISARIPKVQFRVLIRFQDYGNDEINFEVLQLIKLNFKLPNTFDQFFQYSLDLGVGWFEIKVSCFASHLKSISQMMITAWVEAFKISDQVAIDWLIRLAEIKQQHKLKTTPPIQQAINYIKFLLSQSFEYRQLHFQDLNLKVVQDVLNTLAETQRWDVLFYGNLNAELATDIYNSIIIYNKHSNSKQYVTEQIYKIAKHPITFRIPKLTGQSIVTLNLYQGSERTLAQYIYIRILERIMKIQVEDYLYNQQELGFNVTVQMLNILNVDSLAIIVQSSTYDPEEIDFYIEESLGFFEVYLNKLTDKDFQTIISSVQKQISQVPYTLEKQADTVWQGIKDGSYYFTLRECLTIGLEKITKNDLMKFYIMHFKQRNSKLSLQFYQQNSFIPKEVLREQDTYANKVSDLVTSPEQLYQIIKDSYKIKPKYLTDAPHYAC